MRTDEAPSLSVVMPARNDADHLRSSVAAVLDQDYPVPFEVVVAVGPSEDATHEVADQLQRDHPNVKVVDNPDGTTPAGLNAAIAASTGDVIARVDSHSQLSPGYLRRASEMLRHTGADNVGGIQVAVGTTPLQQAIAGAMSSRFGVGDARFHYGGRAGPTDTVYLGVFRRTVLRQLGGYDESLLRNQDYELNWRIRQAGGTVHFDPDLRVTYFPRRSLRDLARQYWQYGYWKAVVLRRHPRSLRWRQLAPPVLVTGHVLALVMASWWPPSLLLPTLYVIACLTAALRSPTPVRSRVLMPAVFAVMHHAWGLGFLMSVAAWRRHPAPPPSESTTGG